MGYSNIHYNPYFFHYMNIGFIGDVHLNAGRRHSQYNGVNVYKTVLGALDQAVDLIPSDDIYFLGDIFDKYSHYDQEVIDFISWIKNHPNKKFFTITGNHDTSKKKFWDVEYNTYNVLRIVEEACDNFHIIDLNKDSDFSYGIYPKQKVRVFGLPYFEYESEFLSALNHVASTSASLKEDGWKTVLLMHQNLEGHVRLSTLKPSDPLFSQFDLVINGHLHKPQWVKKNRFLLQGSLITSTKSDESTEHKNVSVLNLDTFKLRRRYLKGLPIFVYYKEGETLKLEDKNNFVIWEREKKQVEKIEISQEKFSKLPYKKILNGYLEEHDIDPKLLKNLDLKTLDTDVDNAHIDLEFIEIEIEGFGSYVNPTSYKLDNEGITWIRGLPGSGKSTIFKAINWALEGRYYNKENAFADPTSKDDWAELSSTGFRGCRVQLVFKRNGVEHLLIRHRGFKGESLGKKGKNYVHLYKKKNGAYEYINLDQMYEGQFDDIHAALSRNNSKILKYLGLNASMLKYTMVVSPEYFDLISMKQSDVRQVFYSLIDLSWVDELDKQLYDKQKLSESESKELDHSKEVLQTEIKGLTDRIEDHKESYAKDKKEHAAKVKEYTKKHKELTKKRTKYLETIKEQGECIKNYDVDRMGWFEQKYPDEEAKLNRLKLDIDNITAQLNELIEERNAIDIPEENLDDLNSLLNVLKSDRNKQASQDNADSIKSDLIIEQAKKNTLEGEIVDVRVQLSQANAEIKRLTAEVGQEFHTCPTCGQDVSNSGDYIEHHKRHIENLSDELRNHETNKVTLEKALNQTSAHLQEVKDHITKLKGDLDNMKDVYQKFTNEITAVENDIKLKKQAIKSTTDQYTSLSNKINRLQDRIIRKKHDVDELTASFEDIDYLKANFSAYKSCHMKLVAAKRLMKETDSTYELVSSELKELESNVPNKDKIKELTQKRKSLLSEEKSLQKNIDKLGVIVNELTTLRRQVFHARGIKPYAISFYLDYLNDVCAEYAEIAGLQLRTDINESGNFEFKVIIDNTVLDGRELSKGWTTFSNLVLLGGLTRMREINVMSNLLAVDEPFSTVPEESTPVIMNLVRKMAYNKSLHVIAHSSMLESENARFIDVIGGIVKVKRRKWDGGIRYINTPAVSTFS
jgi:DNA repair exonuclease SbcCD ATPase subunit/predicted phosphodiesterase